MDYNVCEMLKMFKRKYPMTIAWRLKAHAKVIDKHLNPDERVLYAFPAQKSKSSLSMFFTTATVITTKRVLIATKRLLWGYYIVSITPDMFNDLTVNSNIIWGKIIMDTVKEVVYFSNLDKSSLDEIETFITEYMMREKKKYKDREKEEKGKN